MFWSKTERGIKAELRLQHHPYDTESWGVLIREAQVQISRVKLAYFGHTLIRIRCIFSKYESVYAW